MDDSLFDQISSLCAVGDSQFNADDPDATIRAFDLMQYTFDGENIQEQQSLATNYVPGADANMRCKIGMAQPRLSDDGRVACPFCGSAALLLGGSTRGEQYTYFCYKNANCAQRWNQRREPNALGDYEITLSRRAIGNEARRSGGYKCGVCGVKPKNGHICLGKATANTASALPMPASNLNLPADSMQVDSTIHEAAEALHAVNQHICATLPVTTTPVRPPTVQSVPRSVPSALLMPGQSMIASGSIASAPPKVVTAELVSPNPDASKAADERHTSTTTNAPLTHSALDVPQNPVHNAAYVYRSLSLRHQSVKGDGSCWIYSILMCVGLLEHSGSADPTPRDRGMDAMCRVMVNVFLSSHRNLLLSTADVVLVDDILRCPDYPLLDQCDYGEFGSNLSILALCYYFKLTCVIWNKKTVHFPQAFQQVAYYDPELDDVCEHLWNYEIVCQMQTRLRIVHIEWDGNDHYAALVGSTPTSMDAVVRAKLLSTPCVVRQKPVSQRLASRRPAEATEQPLPTGWLELPNRIRNDAALIRHGVDENKTRDEHLADALDLDYNAVIMICMDEQKRAEVRYLHFDFEVTASNSAAAGDFSCVLYVYPSRMQRQLSPKFDPSASCICGKFYVGRTSEMQCTVCGRWCHVSCVLGVVDAAVAEEASAKFKCDVCDLP